VLSLSGSHAVQAFIKSAVRRGILGRAVRSEGTLIARRGSGIRSIEGIEAATDLPPSLDTSQRNRLVLRLEADPLGTGGPRCESRLKNAQKPRTILASGKQLDTTEWLRRADYADKVYGKGVEFVSPSGRELFPIQTYQTCNAMSVNYVVWKKTGRVIGEVESYSRIVDLMRDEILVGKRPIHDWYTWVGFADGYDQGAIRTYLRSLGAKVAETPVAQNTRIKLRHIWSALQKGWNVKIIIVFPNNNRHAVIVDGLEVNPSGSVVKVRIYDPNIGMLIKVPAKNFNRIIDRGNTGYGIMTVFRFN